MREFENNKTKGKEKEESYPVIHIIQQQEKQKHC